MTARHILSRWERVSLMLRSCPLRVDTITVTPQRAWMAMLYVSDQGSVTCHQMQELLDCCKSSSHAVLTLLHRNGLVQITNARPPGRRTIAPIYAPTPLLNDVLGLAPQQGGPKP